MLNGNGTRPANVSNLGSRGQEGPCCENSSSGSLLRLAETLGVTETWLRYEVGPAVNRIPIVGRVASGKNFVPFDDAPMGGGFEEIEFSLKEADPIAVEVRGASMAPLYRPGD